MMILDHLNNSDRYRGMHPAFARAFDFLRRPDLGELAVGRHEIDGDRLFALVNMGVGKGRAAARLEAHRRYIDIQFTFSGDEVIGWRPRGMCTSIDEAYDAAKDIEFYHDKSATWLNVPGPFFAIFFPEDGHAPMAGECPYHKIIIKIAV
jgi:biofilm protein TabA